MDSTLVLTIISVVFASSGFWAFMQSLAMQKYKDKTGLMSLVVGLAHIEICRECQKYINRGNITKDEYQDLYVYLYKPYIEAHANGVADKLFKEVQALPVVSSVPEDTVKGE